MAEYSVGVGVKGRDGVWRTLGTVTLDEDEDHYEGFAQAFEALSEGIRTRVKARVFVVSSDGTVTDG